MNKLRVWLRTWLGIDQDVTKKMYWDLRDSLSQSQADYSSAAMRLSILEQSRVREADLAEKLRTLEMGMDALAREPDALRELFAKSIQALQDQIDLMQSEQHGQVVKKDDQPAQVSNGMVRFTQRKRMYEASHAKPITTRTGQQIESNARAIAAGERQAEQP